MTFGSLFSGIGGLDLGLERAGMTCAFQVEINRFCRGVLARHWPEVPRYADVRQCRPTELARVDLLAGGFPCQDISQSGRGAGLAGERSGLWYEYLRLIDGLRPCWVLIENVRALLRRGLATIIGQLTSVGYCVAWRVVSASGLGACHRRHRTFVVANHDRERCEAWLQATQREARAVAARRSGWAAEPEVVRVVHGFPGAVDRRRALGNAVCPPVAELMGRAIMEADHA